MAEFFDFSAALVVVDVAGGDVELLGQILRAAPHLRGVLLERPDAIEAARSTLARVGCADRCQLIAGDFTRGCSGRMIRHPCPWTLRCSSNRHPYGDDDV